MHTKYILFRIVLSVLFILAFGAGLAYAQETSVPEEPGAPTALAGTAFTYQGQLKKSGVPVTAACDFQFTLYDAASSGLQIGPMLPKTGVSVGGGLFSVTLDFGSGAFNGEGRWLGIQVRCPPDATYTDLGRQELTPAPLALALPGLWMQQNATSPSLIGGNSNNGIVSGVYGATISGGGLSASPNLVTDHFGTISGGGGNQAGNADATLDNAWYATVGGGFGNQASGLYTTVGGGSDNRASGESATVGGGIKNQASFIAATVSGGDSNQAGADYSTVGGGFGNQTSALGSTIGGGDNNDATGDATTVGGGAGNQASAQYATVGGGHTNQASAYAATVSGGDSNQASGNGSTVGGGVNNQASATDATVGGGDNNQATDKHATVPGGSNNTAAGTYSFAAGRRAKANHRGAFVWGDATDADVASTADNQFLVRASGGVTLTFASGALRLLPDTIRANIISGDSGNSITTGVYGATISGGGSSFPPFTPNRVTDHFGTVGGGTDNRAGNYDATITNAQGATVGGGMANQASAPSTTVSGGLGNQASAEFATVGGGGANHASGAAATIGGGGNNQASAQAASIGGGAGNQASAQYATIGGGDSSEASGDYATVGGGSDNHATSSYATVGGGSSNVASGDGAIVSGGGKNQATGYTATVPGGFNNIAAGNYSFAAGYRAIANQDGVFIWADSNDYDFTSSAVNQFRARATGGAQFVLAIDSNGNPTWTCSVVNGGSWSCSSDRALKENLVLAEPQQALQQLARVPVYYWNAKGGGARHIGPMAQDFAAAFAVGENNTSLATIDLDGVALAAIQGLYQQNQQLQAENTTLRQQVEDLDQRLSALEQGSSAAQSPQVSQSNTWLLLAGLGLAGILIYQRRRTRGGQP